MTRPTRLAVLAATCLVVSSFAVSARAQATAPSPADDAGEPATTVEEVIVVSATRDEEPRRRVGSAVTVIERAEIEARRAATVAELLRTVPGVEVSQTGPPGGNTSVFLRGGNSSHTLVLIDGVRANAPGVGSFDWADLTTDNVERIEVVRGAQSSLYGSEAIGGVVSIFTRRGTEGLAGGAVAEIGTEDSHRVSTAWRGGRGAWDWSLAAASRGVRGLSAASEANGNREEDPYENRTLSGLVGVDLPGGGRGELTVRLTDSETDLDGFAFPVGPVDDPNYRQDRRATFAALSLEQPLSDRWTAKLHLGTAREDLEARDPDDPFNEFALDSEVTDVTLQSDFELTPNDTLSVGWTYEESEALNVGAFDESVDVTSLFAENRWGWRDRLFFVAGVRHDDHSEFGSETTWRGTASWQLSPGVRLHGSYGTGFKAPTFNELYFPGFGNPELAAETSEGWDAGAAFTLADGRAGFDVTAYGNDVDDLIDFDLATFRAENVAAARIRGVEAESWFLAGGGLQGRLSYTWTDSEDRATGEPLARRPEHRAAAALLWDPAGRWDGSLSAYAVRDRVDSDGSELADYERLDLTVGYELSRAFTAYAKVENLLDDDAAEVGGYTTPGAVASVGLRWRR